MTGRTGDDALDRRVPISGPAPAAVEVLGRRLGVRTVDLVVLAGLVLLAAALRFIGLPARGTWDADQGHDMLVLRDLVTRGVLPLLGPPTSIGDFHHGALYYYVLAPAAWVSGADPVAVVAEIALLGTAAVALVWWIARAMAGADGRAIRGSLAGGVAGLAMAVSATAVNESTFIWNPNLIAFSAALSITAGWRAWTTRSARWWTLAFVAQALTMQAHVLGSAFLIPLLGFLVLDARRGPASRRRRLLLATASGLLLIALSYLPLVAWELGHDFSESRAAVAFLTGGGQAVGLNPVARLVFVGLRIIAWPLTGLLTDALAAGIVAGVVVIAFAVLLGSGRNGLTAERTGVRWLGATLAFSWLILGFGVAGLTTVTPLPVDHYHAFLDPIVFVLVGLGVAALLDSPATVPRVGAIAGIVILVAWNVVRTPPFTATDGGWPAAQGAAARIEQSIDGHAVGLVSLPTFKTAEAYAFPLARDGSEIGATPSVDRIVVVCDALFVSDCGGAAEAPVSAWPILDRFVAAPGRTITVFGRP